jgi:hypothetical protein
MPVDALIQGLQEPTAASSAISLPPKGARLQEPIATSSAVTPPFESVGPQEPIIASPTVIAPPSGADHYFISCRYPPSRIGMFYHQIAYILAYAALLTCLLSGPEPLGVACI